jgi:hypothetical protein
MSEVETVRAVTGTDRAPIMSIREAQELEKRQAYACDYYAIFLKNDATEEFVRVRTPVWHLDAERKPIERDGKRSVRNPHDVALDVWAAYGADDHTLEMVMRGGFVVATPASIASELAMKRIAREA